MVIINMYKEAHTAAMLSLSFLLKKTHIIKQWQKQPLVWQTTLLPQKMPRVTTILSKGRKALQDFDLLKVLRSEIAHELSSNPFQNYQGGSLRNFVLDSDLPHSQDVVLRNKCESGGEIAVSAMLGPETGRECIFPREVLMKVCIKKPGLSSVLQFDCGVSLQSDGGSDFDIRKTFYFQSTNCIGPKVYRGPLFSTLDPDLQDALKQYLIAKGIEESLTKFLLLHLHKKEQHQYVNWLHKLEVTVANDE